MWKEIRSKTSFSKSHPKRRQSIWACGWLIVWVIGLILFIFIYLLNIGISTIGEINYVGLIYYAIGMILLVVGYWGWLTYLFFAKKKLFVKVNNGLLWMVIIFSSLNLIFFILRGYILDYDSFSQIIGIIGISILWLIYFNKSKRVKNTFVR